MAVLDRIASPRDLRRLDDHDLDVLAGEIRAALVAAVSRTGGHLGPNLGVVELTLALHRVFDSPHDPIVFDTGHQAYVHKMVTGRRDQFDRLRQPGGLSGYPSRRESEHDWVENSHASTSLSYAEGLAKGYRLRGETDRRVVAVIGDGALTGGMAWEALNNISGQPDLPLVIVVNDNGRSYSPTVGGIAHYLDSLRTNPGYERALSAVKSVLTHTPVVGQPMFEALHGVKKGVKDVLAPQGMFEDLGLKYVGPVDGHDRPALEHALRAARRYHGPVIVHCVTEKGRGYDRAEQDQADLMHGPGPFDPDTGLPTSPPTTTWTSVFSDEVVRLGRTRPDLVAITAAMLQPTGLKAFAEAFPDRCFDVGIAEQHAVTSAAGLAMTGLHPLVAVYATFLNRAFDQVLMDVALHGLPVTFVLDRAGVTGDDGASHNGMWDLSLLQLVPGIRLAAPRDASRLRELLGEAVATEDGPTVVRFPKGGVPSDLTAVSRLGDTDVLVREGAQDVLVVTVGPMATLGVDVAERLADQGIGVTVVDPRWVLPVDPVLVDLARQHRFVLTVEDNGRVGGVGARLAQAMRDADVWTPLRDAGVPQQFLEQGKRAALMADMGLTAQNLARLAVEHVAGLEPSSPASLTQP
ncbi:MAG: 1-deoxy-D-xylulose-5-phosphate synthase [Acidimicrobiales bacterium]|nr:1-deoxy-D-xylulose-5-phosphate synthase [Acidimicrobiales bacterium]